MEAFHVALLTLNYKTYESFKFPSILFVYDDR